MEFTLLFTDPGLFEVADIDRVPRRLTSRPPSRDVRNRFCTLRLDSVAFRSLPGKHKNRFGIWPLSVLPSIAHQP
jgi:hypothetical protein